MAVFIRTSMQHIINANNAVQRSFADSTTVRMTNKNSFHNGHNPIDNSVMDYPVTERSRKNFPPNRIGDNKSTGRADTVSVRYNITPQPV